MSSHSAALRLVLRTQPRSPLVPSAEWYPRLSRAPFCWIRFTERFSLLLLWIILVCTQVSPRVR